MDTEGVCERLHRHFMPPLLSPAPAAPAAVSPPAIAPQVVPCPTQCTTIEELCQVLVSRVPLQGLKTLQGHEGHVKLRAVYGTVALLGGQDWPAGTEVCAAGGTVCVPCGWKGGVGWRSAISRNFWPFRKF